MNIVIRTDASEDIGTGHVMRCLVLAEDLRKKNENVSFICRELSGNLINYINAHGFTVHTLPFLKSEKTANHLDWLKKNWKTDMRQTIQIISNLPYIDWLIIDHYAIDLKWEQNVKSFVKKVMVIDDLANRSHNCDLLLDQNLFRNMEDRYIHLIPKSATALLGTKYLLLRQEFKDRRCLNERNGMVKRILISFGGSDPTNETLKVLQAVKIINIPNLTVDVVVGSSNRNYQAIKKYCEKLSNTRIHYQINYIAELMEKADLALGAGGSTTWERCYMGLPTITIETADNQSEILSYLTEIGAVRHLGKSRTVTVQDLVNVLREIIHCPNQVKKMVDATKCVMSEFENGAVVKRLLKENTNG